MSDATPDTGPGAESAMPGYRLSAWVSNAPTGSRVFFAVAQRTIDIEISGRSDAEGSTWEANWRIPEEILDGAAESTCRAAQRVVLKARRPGQKFWTIGLGGNRHGRTLRDRPSGEGTTGLSDRRSG